MSVLEITNVKKYYKDVKALDDVTFSVNDGELFGLLGVNGAGKTTIVKLSTGLIDYDSGEVKVCGYDVKKDLDKVSQVVNLSPQETSVALNLTVLENLKFFKDVYGIKDDSIVDELIKAFHLEEFLNKKAKTLSGGYQRRLSIAIGLISSPKLLFLDEPTLGLDVIARRELWNIINNLKSKLTIILTSHYLEEIEALCDRVAILKSGKLLAIGTVDEIKKIANKDTFGDAFIEISGGLYEN